MFPTLSSEIECSGRDSRTCHVTCKHFLIGRLLASTEGTLYFTTKEGQRIPMFVTSNREKESVSNVRTVIDVLSLSPSLTVEGVLVIVSNPICVIECLPDSYPTGSSSDRYHMYMMTNSDSVRLYDVTIHQPISLTIDANGTVSIGSSSSSNSVCTDSSSNMCTDSTGSNVIRNYEIREVLSNISQYLHKHFPIVGIITDKIYLTNNFKGRERGREAKGRERKDEHTHKKPRLNEREWNGGESEIQGKRCSVRLRDTLYGHGTSLTLYIDRDLVHNIPIGVKVSLHNVMLCQSSSHTGKGKLYLKIFTAGQSNQTPLSKFPTCIHVMCNTNTLSLSLCLSLSSN